MIKIRVLSYNNEPPALPQEAVFGRDGASIGRDKDNFLVLPDPKRYVSRVQASVKSDGQRHTIVNLSQANPILINGDEVSLGMETPLRPGDDIQIGLYLLRAELAEGSAAARPANLPAANQTGAHAAIRPNAPVAAPTSLPSKAPAAPAPAQASNAATFDLGMLGGTSGGADPFADLMGGANDSAAITADPLLPAAPAPAVPTVPAAPILHSVPHSAQPAADPGSFDDLLGTPAPSQQHVAPRAPAATPADPFGFDDLLAAPIQPSRLLDKPASIIPDDFDPFALPSAQNRNSADPLANIAANEVSLESIGGKSASIDSLLARDRADGPSQLDPGALDHTSSETDPLRLFGSDSLLPSSGHNQDFSQVGSDHTPEIKGYFAMPQAVREAQQPPVVEERAPLHVVPQTLPQTAPQATQQVAPQVESVAQPHVAPPAPIAPPAPKLVEPAPDQAATMQPAGQPTSQSGGLDPHELAQAFLRGAKLPPDTIPNGVSLEWMEMIGKFVATATQGAVDLIASRALVKREVKADVTMIVVRNNNPLKFLPDGESALIQMLSKKIPGFMEPTAAMQDAYIDLRAHQIGVFAGMRAALAEVLKRFDPEQLENKLKRKTVMDSLMASNRKGKLWDLYGELFKEIYIEAQDDFQTLFGKAFVTAYEAEIERFANEAKSEGRHG